MALIQNMEGVHDEQWNFVVDTPIWSDAMYYVRGQVEEVQYFQNEDTYSFRLYGGSSLQVSYAVLADGQPVPGENDIVVVYG